MKRIILFTDSLALPRKIPEVTYYEDTYPYLLRNDFEVFQFSKGGARIVDLLEQVFYYQQYKPDCVIIQSGIVDCAPRAFSWNEELFMQSNICGKAIRKLLSLTITTKKLRNFRQKSWTDIVLYERCCKKFKDLFPNIPVYAISIVPASDEYERKVPGINNKINRYNDMLRKAFGGVISLHDIPFTYIMSDGHHLNKLGHKYVYERIMEQIKF